MAIRLPKDVQARLLREAKAFAADELEVDLGDLKASLLLDFMLGAVGPVVYNQAIADAQAYFAEKVEDLPGARHEPETAHPGRR